MGGIASVANAIPNGLKFLQANSASILASFSSFVHLDISDFTESRAAVKRMGSV